MISATKKIELHFDLSDQKTDEELFLCVGLKEYPLKKHDDNSRQKLKGRSLFYACVPEEHITHTSGELTIGADTVTQMNVIKYIDQDGQKVPFSVSLHAYIPETSYQQMLNKTNAHTLYTSGIKHPKLKRFEYDHEQLASTLESEEDGIAFYLDATTFNDVTETAKAILLHHPDLLNLNGKSHYPAWIKEHLIDRNPHLNELILTLFDVGNDWCKMLIAKDAKGDPIKNPDNPKEFIHTRKLNHLVIDSLKGPINWAVKKAKDAPELENEVWNVQHGKTDDKYGSKLVPPGATNEIGERAEINARVKWSVTNHTPSWGLTIDKPTYEPVTQTLQIVGYNRWPRHLGSYIEYLKPNGDRMELTPQQWESVIGDFFHELMPESFFNLIEPRAETKFKEYISPITTVCGIPLGSLLPDPTKYDLPVFEDAYGIRVIWAGIGLNGDDEDDSVCTLVGTFLTVIVDLIVPVIIFTAGASGLSNKILKVLTKDKEVFKAVIGIASLYITHDILSGLNKGRNIITILTPYIGKILPSLLITKLGPYIMEKIGEGTIGRFLKAVLPEAETALQVFNAATTVASLMETVAACVSGPAIHKTDYVRSIDLDLTINPDKRYHKFPDLATSCQVQIVYNSDTTTPVCEHKYDMTGPTRSKPFHITFTDVPAAGKLKVLIFFYAENGWQTGQGESTWLKAKGNDQALLKITVETKTNIVPLTIDSIYRHKQKTAYETEVLKWQATKTPPTATYQTASPDPDRSINSLKGMITMAQYPAMLGYSWQAKGLPDKKVKTPSREYKYTVQNISTLQDPNTSLWCPDEGYKLPTGIFYDVTGPETNLARNYFIDSSKGVYDERENPEGGYHLRKLSFVHDQKPGVDMTHSWGRFNSPMERFAIHPQGYALGINYTYCKLEILKLPQTPYNDTDARFASINAGEGFRDGLIKGPSGIAVALDGRILILESINNRIQAFDLYGNPVKCFKCNEEEKRCWFPLHDKAGTKQYLDLAVESKGYMYILSFANDGSKPEDYHLDIYTPDGAFLVRTENITASKIAVSILRNVFTLNYEILFGAGKRPEPSVSMWTPPPPKK